MKLRVYTTEAANASALAFAAAFAAAPRPPPYRFQEFATPRLSRVVPRGGSVAGGLTVTVRGAGFHAFAIDGVVATAQAARCRFGGAAGVESRATPLNDSQRSAITSSFLGDALNLIQGPPVGSRG